MQRAIIIFPILLVFGFFCDFFHLYPVAPNPLSCAISLNRYDPGKSYPLIVSGSCGRADFIYIKWIAPNLVTVGYDSWGHGGVMSMAIPFIPGAKRRLTIVAPILNHTRIGAVTDPTDRLIISVDDRVILSDHVHYYVSAAPELRFAENPAGGASCGPILDGYMELPDGTRLDGGLLPPRSLASKALLIVRDYPQRLGLTIVLAAAISILLTRVTGKRLNVHSLYSEAMKVVSLHKHFIFAAALCSLGFYWLLCAGTPKLIYEDNFGSFYDFQAASILSGHLDVPYDCLQGEAFLVHGKYYGYFGILPGLLRIPFVAFGIALGCLTRSFMLTYYVSTLIAAYSTLVLLIRNRVANKRSPEAWMTWLLMLNIGLGSSLIFLAGRAFVYHEAIISGVAFCMWGIFWGAKSYLVRSVRYALFSLCFGLCAVHCRPTIGLYSLTFTALTCVVSACPYLRHKFDITAAKFLGISALAVLAFLTFNALSYAKFGTIEGMPLKFNMEFLGDPGRIARIHGSIAHFSNIPTNLHAYFLSFNATFEKHFPFIEDHSQEILPGAIYDMNEHILALPYTMPGLVLMAVSAVLAVSFCGDPMRGLTFIALVSAIPFVGALLVTVVSSQRYTADFIPLLSALAAIALSRYSVKRPLVLIICIYFLCALISILVGGLLAIHYQGKEGWGAPGTAVARYQKIESILNSFFNPR
jgi:hypothetical protein